MHEIIDLIYEDINSTFERDPHGTDASTMPALKRDPNDPEPKGSEMMHDTEGWKSLETSFRLL